MFNSADATDIHKIYPPTHNSAFGFAITPTSYHAVSTPPRRGAFFAGLFLL